MSMMIFIYMNEAKRMLISERIFKLIKEKKMTQKDFAERVGIAGSTVSEWKKKKTNPSSDKIMDICSVLGVTPEQLLTGNGIDKNSEDSENFNGGYITQYDMRIIEAFHEMDEERKKRLLAYVDALKALENMEKNV